MICFQETTNGGFGDRLRGVAYLLHLARRHRERTILYNDDVSLRSEAFRRRCFPWRMTDLVRVEGRSFAYHPLPLPPAKHHVVYDSLPVRPDDERPGFRAMRRLRPRDDEVLRRVAALGVDRRCIGFHARETDNVAYHASLFEDRTELEARALANLAHAARRRRTRRVLLVADNADTLARWSARLARAGYELRTTDPDYDASRMRQTSAFDMLVDFFALAACRRVVRLTPSEFSRFAAWIGGRRLDYLDLR